MPRVVRSVLAGAGPVWVALIVLACVATLPYTMSAPGTARTPRYAATDLDRALLPPFWAPHRLDERERIDALAAQGVRARPWLGTDRLGRDLLTRCLVGGGISLAIGAAAALVAVGVGTLYGTMAGLSGRRTDGVLMRVVDVLYGLPTILLVVLIAVAVDGLADEARAAQARGADTGWGGVLALADRDAGWVNVVTLLVAIGGVSWLTLARVIRGQVLSLRGRPFMEAAMVVGTPLSRRVRVHVLPNLAGPIIVYGTLAVPAAILSESFLSFLGIGVREPLPSWGNLAADGLAELNVVRSRWWLLVWPCVLVGLTLLAINGVGERLRRRLDPRSEPTS